VKRFLAALAAVTLLVAAAPMHRQPTPATTSAETSARRDADDRSRIERISEQNAKDGSARDKAWDAQMKRTMSGICTGC
jgi:hypothetical protein